MNSRAAAQSLNALVDHLRTRREAILESWRRLVDNDPQLTTAATLPKVQFYDHIPEVLDALEERLLAADSWEHRDAPPASEQGAALHGLQRWQQGYNQRETIREWAHLNQALVDELEKFAESMPEPQVMRFARRTLASLIGDGVSESAMQYAELRQADAASRAIELKRALEAVNALEQQRAKTWREAAHDLRGNVGVLRTAVALLESEATSPEARTQSMEVLRRSVHSLHGLLSDLINLSRLEAGQESQNVTTFDAAAVLRAMCESLRPVAAESNLFLRTEGPQSLQVQGDEVKVTRIAQNLLLNSLRYTDRGGVVVSWEACGTQQRPQWRMSIADTGPGIAGAPGAAPIVRKLEEATREQVGAEAQELSHSAVPHAEATKQESHGEGIGLMIVKRLCELLDASLELQSQPDLGTTFRVTFPRRYTQH